MGKKLLPLIIIFFSIWIAGKSLFSPGLFPTHDGEYHIIRFYEFSKVLQSGIIYPRWAPDLNYGYGVPLFNFVYPLPSYIAFFLHILSISFITGFKMSLFFALCLSAFGIYFWAKEFWGKTGGIIASICYTFSPYHFVDIYIRGSIGEVWALGFYPWFLYSITRYKYQKNIKWFFISNIIFGLIIFSHNILALAFMPFAVVYAFLIFFNKKNLYQTCAKVLSVFIIGISMSAIFWLPALFETKFTIGLQVFGIDANFPDLFQLLIPSWGSGFFGSDLQNQMSVQIGIANIIASLMSAFIGIKLFLNKDKRFPVTLFMLCSFVCLFLLMLSISLPVWKIVPLMNYFQFPWRFLSLIILITSFLAGSVVIFNKNIIFIAFYVIFIIFLSFPYSKPAYYMLRNDSYYTSRSNFIDGTNSPGNAFNTIYAQGVFSKQKEKITYFSGKGILQMHKNFPEEYNVSVVNLEHSVLAIHTAYFPGWKAQIDAINTPIEKASDGSMLLPVSNGKHDIVIWFGNTNIRLLSILISFFSLILVLTLSLKSWYSKRK